MPNTPPESQAVPPANDALDQAALRGDHSVLDHPDVTSKHLADMVNGTGLANNLPTNTILSHPKVDGDVLHAVIDYGRRNSYNYKGGKEVDYPALEALAHPLSDETHIDKAISSLQPGYYTPHLASLLVGDIQKHPKATPKHLLAALKELELNPDTLFRLLDHSNEEVQAKAKKGLHVLVDHGDDIAARRLSEHSSFGSEDISRFLKSTNYSAKASAIGHKLYGADPQHEKLALESARAGNVRDRVIQKLKNPEAIEKIIEDGGKMGWNDVRALARHEKPAIAARAIEKMLGSSDPNDRSSILGSPQASKKHAALAWKTAKSDWQKTDVIRYANKLPLSIHRQALMSDSRQMSNIALERPDTTTKMIRDAWTGKLKSLARMDQGLLQKITEHPNTPDDVWVDAIKAHLDKDRHVERNSRIRKRIGNLTLPQRMEIINHHVPDLNDFTVSGPGHDTLQYVLETAQEEHVPGLANHPNPFVRSALIGSKKFSADDLLALYADPVPTVAREAQREELDLGRLQKFAESAPKERVEKWLDYATIYGELGGDNTPIAVSQIALSHKDSDIRGRALELMGTKAKDRGDWKALATPEHLAAALASEDPKTKAAWLSNGDLISSDELDKHIPQNADDGPGQIMARAILSNKNATSEQIDRILEASTISPYPNDEYAVQHPNISPDSLKHLFFRNSNRNASYAVHRVAKLALQNDAFPLDYLQQIANKELVPEWSDEAEGAIEKRHPDAAFPDGVDVRLETNKLRQIRDEVSASSKPIHKNAFKDRGVNLDDYTKTGTGYLDAEKIQQAIDSKEPLHYRVSHDTWKDAQRHSDENSKVLQVNMSTKLIEKLKSEKLYGTFKRMLEITNQSGHPAHPTHGIGWVRYTQAGDPQNEGEECERCGGHGTVEEEWLQGCETCGGNGDEVAPADEGLHSRYHGTGIDPEATTDCGTCDGSGEQLNSEFFHPRTKTALPVTNDEGQSCEGGHGAYGYGGYKPCEIHDSEDAKESCEDCNGNGQVPDSEAPCKDCDGAGYRQFSDSSDCPDCDGTGGVKRKYRPALAKDKDHFFVDEVQSDFGQNFAKTLAANERNGIERMGVERGLRGQELESFVETHMAKVKDELAKFPQEETDRIAEILFQGKHSNEILTEAFLQYLRNEGFHGSTIGFHSSKSKAPISLGRDDATKWIDPKNKNRRVDVNENGKRLDPSQISNEDKERWKSQGFKEVPDLPAHFLNTYEKIPTKVLGFKPGIYGEMDRDVGEDGDGDGNWHGDQPIYRGSVLKAEDWDFIVLEKADLPAKKFSDPRVKNPAPTQQNDVEKALDILKNSHDKTRRLLVMKMNPHPAVLEEAARDEDPDIRMAAASHPALTTAARLSLLRDGDDEEQRAILRRPDIGDAEFLTAWQNMHLRSFVSTHPNLSPHFQERLLGRKDGELAKSIGLITFPGFGEGAIHSRPHLRDEKAYLAAAPEQITAEDPAYSKGNFMPSGEMPKHQRVLFGSVNTSPKPPSQDELASDPVAAGRRIQALDDHETQHMIFRRIDQKYGRSAGLAVRARLLASLPKESRDLLNESLEKYNSKYIQNEENLKRDPRLPIRVPEELLTHLQNYLQDPTYRHRVHSELNLDQKKAYEHHAKVKEAFLHMRDVARKMTPEDLGLAKAENEPNPDSIEHQLGENLELETYCRAASFMTGKELNRQLVNKMLRESGDVKEAVLLAAGLDSEDDRKAFDGIASLQSMSKSEPVAASVKGLFGADELADEVKKAYETGGVEQIYLKGKHATGAHIASLSNGNKILLKPGTAKMSPASGVKDLNVSQSRRESAAYAIAEFLGLQGDLPETKSLVINGHETAAIAMLPATFHSLHKQAKGDSGKVLESRRLDGTIHKWAIFDYIIGQADRHGSNVLFEDLGQNNYDVKLIDHGSTFAGHNFNPAEDENSFVPFYLRAGIPWSKTDWESRKRLMAQPPRNTWEMLREWVKNIDSEELKHLVEFYGIPSVDVINRLMKVKVALELSPDAGQAINSLWQPSSS